MREKFTLLIICAAFLVLGAGTAWGQTIDTDIFWNSGCDCSNSNLGLHPATCGYRVEIDGHQERHWSDFNMGAFNKPSSVAGGSGVMSKDATKETYWTFWNVIEERYEVWVTHWTSRWTTSPQSNCGTGNNEACNNGVYVWDEGTSEFVRVAETVPVCGGWGSQTAPTGHTHHHITVALSAVAYDLLYKSPHWTHQYYVGAFSTSNGAISWTPTSHTTNGADVVPSGTMYAADGGLRLTGSMNQVEKVTGSTLTNTTLDFNTTGSKELYFDKDWDGSFNNVTSTWTLPSAGVTTDQAIGFLSAYTGTAIPVTGGVVALGPDPLGSVERNMTITSSQADVRVNAYNRETNYCDPAHPDLGAANVGYRVGVKGITSTTINVKDLNITNTNGECTAVDFVGELFTPIFSGGGRLYINPNVTNFHKGVTFASAQSGNIDIYSKNITTTTGDFIYNSTGTNNLHVWLTIPQAHTSNCLGCGIFDVQAGDFSTTHHGSSNVLIDGAGSVSISGDYTHANTSSAATNKSHEVNVTGNINIKGTTDLKNVGGDDITYISQNSWINFGTLSTNNFTYTPSAGTSDLLIHAKGACDVPFCGAFGIGGYVEFKGAVTTKNVTDGTTTIKSENHHVTMNQGFLHVGETGDLLVQGAVTSGGYIEILNEYGGPLAVIPSGTPDGVLIERSGTGKDQFLSAGHIHIAHPFTYNNSGSKEGLLVKATGACAGGPCGALGGYVLFDRAVTINHSKNDGYSEITSSSHYVEIGKGYYYEGVDGDNKISGHTAVVINGEYGGNVPAAPGSAEGVYIHRTGSGNDSLISRGGYVEVEKPFTYIQTGANKSGLSIFAGGNCFANAAICAQYGYVLLKSPVTTQNVLDGHVRIISNKHYVTLDEGLVHQGVHGNLRIDGYSYVDINNPYPIDETQNLVNNITLPKKSGELEGVFIERIGTGSDSIVSRGGHVRVTNPFTYTQTSVGPGTSGNENGLDIFAQGPCSVIACDDPISLQDRGYVWLQNDVWTQNDAFGPTRIISENHYIRIGETATPSNNFKGGHFTHSGENGSLSVLAKGTCFDPCLSIPGDLLRADNLLAGLGLFEHDGRGYVWIGDDVKITMSGGGAGKEGNAVIRSYADVVQLDDTVIFSDTKGANLWIDGKYGVRTLGPTILTNKAFNDGAPGTATGVQGGYATAGQGYVTYLSEAGGVDFGISPDKGNDNPSTLGGNTPFLYTAVSDTNALLIEGYSRVFFGDSVTIKMGDVATTGGTTKTGNAKIYSPAGWIKFADTLGYTGTTGDLIIYANGGTDNLDEPNVEVRSKWLENGTCEPHRGGFVLFDSLTQISYWHVIDTGKTWIRSNNDDVVMGSMFTYFSEEPDHTDKPTNGEFIMQAGQDIYGKNKNFKDSIRFIQAGDSSILLEAKKTIHLQQNLFFDRAGAVTGDITLKAGYPTFAAAIPSIDRHPASYKDAIPTAYLGALDWSTDGCTPNDYLSRWPGQSLYGGDIWLEGRVHVDLTKTKSTDKTIALTMRAYNSIFIDSTFVYDQDTINNTPANDNILLFAETGNVEAAVTRQDDGHGYVADDTVRFALNTNFSKEFRMQAGNKPWFGGENIQPTNFTFGCWEVGCLPGAEFDGNILYNKPFLFNNKGTGYSIISSARDIETQVMAPFVFTYNGGHRNSGNLDITAGRHIETHAKMQFNYVDLNETGNIMMQAGRLDQKDLTSNYKLGKGFEVGTALTDPANNANPFKPELATGDSDASNTGVKNNAFAEGGSGNGSILIFDSLEFNYAGRGNILLTALNGNIESDPYLHRNPLDVANPGNLGDGYLPHTGFPPAIDNSSIQHDAQITFNHAGEGPVTMEAIDIKLHDKIAYYGKSHPSGNNGDMLMHAFDSILTRNIEYVNKTDKGSIHIITDKFKDITNVAVNKSYTCDPVGCGTEGRAIQQGHIVLGYGADRNMREDGQNMNDSIIFDFSGNTNTVGANVIIRAGYKGFVSNALKGTTKHDLFPAGADKGKGYGGNITFDFMVLNMALGNHSKGGYLEISTPNGNIWGKDSMVYSGHDGDILVDAGAGSKDDPDAIRWEGFGCENGFAGGSENTLNTEVPYTCGDPLEWRTGNIMMKGASLNYNEGKGNATFRTREGYIDMYDAFTVEDMEGHLLFYAGTNDAKQTNNQWGDVSLRDFQYTQTENSGSIFFGADDNIMLNYGYSNDDRIGDIDGYMYKGREAYEIMGGKNPLVDLFNPYYWTTYKDGIDAYRAVFNVNDDGYMWYRQRGNDNDNWIRKYHRLYRGCSDTNGSNCSGTSSVCKTTDNFARPLMFDFNQDNTIKSGGVAVVATNYIDMFTEFTYLGGHGKGLAAVPDMTTLHGEQVEGYGLYLKSLFDGQLVEKRRVTCEDCGKPSNYPIGKGSNADPSLNTYEWTYIGFHDDARIHTNNQKSLIEAPVVEFFGHAELDTYNERGTKTKLTVKADSLIFHDSVIFQGRDLELLPYTTGERRDKDMRYGVINDRGETAKFYRPDGPAIAMSDRNTPVMEFGYQRCNEPLNTPFESPNLRSEGGLEAAPRVGGDIIVAFRNEFALPIQNTVVANHARISFVNDMADGIKGGEYVDACVRTDLLRIRNKVEFYTEPGREVWRSGTLKMVSQEQIITTDEVGIFPHHLHTEPGSELSLPGENSLLAIQTTTIGGYGTIHENIRVQAHGIIAPGYASLMEGDCQTPYKQGKLTIHNLYMEPDAIMRISIGEKPMNCVFNPETLARDLYCTQADTLSVQDSIFTWGKVGVQVLAETDYIEPGCYLFLEYNDMTTSPEYVKNLHLLTKRIGDHYLALDFSERGRVYLCVVPTPVPMIQRYVHIHSVEGVKTTPTADLYHYVFGHEDFVFTAEYADKTETESAPYDVQATGYYTQQVITLRGQQLMDGSYQYRIRQVVEPWDVYFVDPTKTVGNGNMLNQKVWSYKNTLYVNVDKNDVVSVHNMTGLLFRKVDVPAGLNKMTLEKGVYMVTLQDGTVFRIIIN